MRKRLIIFSPIFQESGEHELCICTGALSGHLASVQIALFDRENLIRRKPGSKFQRDGEKPSSVEGDGNSFENATDEMMLKLRNIWQDIRQVIIYQRESRNVVRDDYSAMLGSQDRVFIFSLSSIVAMFVTVCVQVLTVRAFFINKSATSVSAIIGETIGM